MQKNLQNSLRLLANTYPAELGEIIGGAKGAIKRLHQRAIIEQAKTRWERMCGSGAGGGAT